MSRVLAPALALSIAIATGSLIGDAEALLGPVPGCCVCSACSHSALPADVVCKTVIGNATCTDLCDSHNCFTDAFNAGITCSDESVSGACADALNLDTGTMAPAVSPVGLTALAAILSGFGVFFVRRRSS